MFKPTPFFVAGVIAWQTILSSSAQEPASRTVPVIFDTDIGNDVDDCLALGMIHALESRRECKLLAVTITKDHVDAAPFVDCINTFYGRGTIPIGVCRSGITPEPGSFNRLANVQDNNQDRFPHDLRSGDQAESAVVVLRKALAAAEDHSVMMIQVGFSTNLARLLDSPADAISPLDGVQLVSAKVMQLSIMAGAFTKIPGDKGEWVEHREYNVVQDLASAKKLAAEWPTEILWSGFEIGLALPYPHQSILKDYRYVAHHPLAEAYHLYIPPPHDRPTWDLTSVLVGIRPDRDYFGLSPQGHVTVEPDGLTRFEEVSNGKHRYLTLTDVQRARTLEALQVLSSQPPQQ